MFHVPFHVAAICDYSCGDWIVRTLSSDGACARRLQVLMVLTLQAGFNPVPKPHAPLPRYRAERAEARVFDDLRVQHGLQALYSAGDRAP